jgi:hypothetical protein
MQRQSEFPRIWPLEQRSLSKSAENARKKTKLPMPLLTQFSVHVFYGQTSSSQ